MISIRDTLAQLPMGRRIPTLSWSDVASYLKTHYLNARPEEQRREKAARRQRFYLSGGDADMAKFIAGVIKDPRVRNKRLEWIEHAKFNNVLRRIVHELATVYSEPASRTVSDPASNLRYQELQRRCRQHEVMLRANRLALLHRNIVIGPRIRDVNGSVDPVLDVVTPDNFYAVAHPLDPLALVALVFDLRMTLVASTARTPRYVVWTAREMFQLDYAGNVLDDSVVEHAYGRIPWILFSLEPPNGTLLDTTSGDDLEAAHRAVWLMSVLLLKESKSATKQHVLFGDVSRLTRDQAADTDVPIEGGEGTSIQTIDNSMDLSMFVDTARSIYETAAANYGLPPSLLKHDGVQSAEARELVRIPLREIRLQQQIPFRDLERELAELQSMVVGPAIPELAFNTAGWSIDFADPQTPLGTKEALEVFKQERQLGLTSTKAEILRRNPDLTEEQADKLLQRFVDDEVERNVRMRPLAAIAGSPNATLDDDERDDLADKVRDDDDDDGNSGGAQ